MAMECCYQGKLRKNATVGTRKSCLQLEKEVVAPNDEEME